MIIDNSVYTIETTYQVQDQESYLMPGDNVVLVHSVPSNWIYLEYSPHPPRYDLNKIKKYIVKKFYFILRQESKYI